jgi:hypothetical protein
MGVKPPIFFPDLTPNLNRNFFSGLAFKLYLSAGKSMCAAGFGLRQACAACSTYACGLIENLG